ncbi:hypothetical protein [Streptomyces sp. NPDC093105]|uniref:hypothetical protein n=1 Tax=Streptomyces sp. NPDC093105 TaxID=3366029 RepID=UPI00380F7B7B
MAQDWAEQHRRIHGPGALLSATSSFGTPQPRGLVDDHNRLTKVIHVDGEQTQEAARTLAWWPAVALTVGPDSLFPISALRVTPVEAVLSHLARDAEMDRSTLWLSPLHEGVAKISDWYIQHKPDRTASLLSEICLKAQERVDLHPATVGSIIRRSLRLHSTLGEETVDSLLGMALPPSANSPENLTEEPPGWVAPSS